MFSPIFFKFYNPQQVSLILRIGTIEQYLYTSRILCADDGGSGPLSVNFRFPVFPSRKRKLL